MTPHRLTLTAAAVVVACTTLGGCATAHSPSPVAAAVMPAGCGPRGPVVLVVAGRAGAPAPEMSSAMSAAVDDAAATGAPVGIVSVEGVPHLVAAGTLRVTGHNDATRAQERARFVEGVAAGVRAVRAQTPHADPVAALAVGGAAVRGACPGGGRMFLQDSGLADAGVLDMAAEPDLLDAAPADVGRFLAAHHQAPDLAGVEVTLGGLGYTAPPQAPLDPEHGARLTSTMTAVAGVGGATAVVVDPSPRGGPAPDDVPPVTPVPVRPPARMVVNPVAGTTALADTGPVGFLPDSATLRDPDDARRALGGLARAVTDHPGTTVVLTGTTSSAGAPGAAGDADRDRLSLARADAVRVLLAELGVDPGRVTTTGVGARFPGFRPDRDAQGVLMPGTAATNRTVQVRLR